MAIAYYLGNKILDAYLRNTSLAIAQAYASLHTGDPGITGANECTGGSYGRQTIEFDAAANNATANTNQEEWTSMPECDISYLGLWDASSSGNFMQAGGITGAPKSVNAGDTVRAAVGAIDVTIT